MPPQEFRTFKRDPSEEPKRFTKLLLKACEKMIDNYLKKDDPNKDAMVQVETVTDDQGRYKGAIKIGKISTKHFDINQPGMVGIALFYQGETTVPFDINKAHPQWLQHIKTCWQKHKLHPGDIKIRVEKYDPELGLIDGQVLKDELEFDDPDNKDYQCCIVYRFEAPRENEADIPAPVIKAVDKNTTSPAQADP